ncbi:MAG: tail fiber domain-containing protein [Alkalilacustris sp.]
MLNSRTSAALAALVIGLGAAGSAQAQRLIGDGAIGAPAFQSAPSAPLDAHLRGDDLGNHTATEDLNLSGFRIVNVGDPTSPTSAVNLRTLIAEMDTSTIVRTFGNQTVAGVKTFTSHLHIRNAAPTLILRDTDHRSAMLHLNNNYLHVLRGSGVDSTSWEQVNGQWPMMLDLNTNNAFFGGGVWAASYFHHSDERLKEDIADIDVADIRERLLALRPVSYSWVGRDGERSFGLIAQELQEVFPSLVAEMADGMLSVDYAQMISPMLSVLHDMDGDLESLRGENAQLREALQGIEARLAAVEGAARQARPDAR